MSSELRGKKPGTGRGEEEDLSVPVKPRPPRPAPLLFSLPSLPRTMKGLRCGERGDLSPFSAIKWGNRVHTLTLSLKGVQDVLTRPVERLSNFPVTNLPYLFCSNRLIVSSKRLKCSGMRSPETCLNNYKLWSWARQETGNQLLRQCWSDVIFSKANSVRMRLLVVRCDSARQEDSFPKVIPSLDRTTGRRCCFWNVLCKEHYCYFSVTIYWLKYEINVINIIHS